MSQNAASEPRRSERTRAAILAAARERFASDGYDRATIRAIAADAGIDPALVMRHFGSKDKLFAAAAEFDLRLPELAELPRTRVGKALATHLLQRWEGDDTLRALLRAAVSHPAAAERMRTIFASQLLPPITRLCGGDRREAAARAGLVASQTLGLALTRFVLELPPVVAMDRDELVRWLAPTLQRYLTGTA